jgi:hypothetical protein
MNVLSAGCSVYDGLPALVARPASDEQSARSGGALSSSTMTVMITAISASEKCGQPMRGDHLFTHDGSLEIKPGVVFPDEVWSAPARSIRSGVARSG